MLREDSFLAASNRIRSCYANDGKTSTGSKMKLDYIHDPVFAVYWPSTLIHLATKRIRRNATATANSRRNGWGEKRTQNIYQHTDAYIHAHRHTNTHTNGNSLPPKEKYSIKKTKDIKYKQKKKSKPFTHESTLGSEKHLDRWERVLMAECICVCCMVALASVFSCMPYACICIFAFVGKFPHARIEAWWPRVYSWNFRHFSRSQKSYRRLCYAVLYFPSWCVYLRFVLLDFLDAAHCSHTHSHADIQAIRMQCKQNSITLSIDTDLQFAKRQLSFLSVWSSIIIRRLETFTKFDKIYSYIYAVPPVCSQTPHIRREIFERLVGNAPELLCTTFEQWLGCHIVSKPPYTQNLRAYSDQPIHLYTTRSQKWFVSMSNLRNKVKW